MLATVSDVKKTIKSWFSFIDSRLEHHQLAMLSLFLCNLTCYSTFYFLWQHYYIHIIFPQGLIALVWFPLQLIIWITLVQLQLPRALVACTHLFKLCPVRMVLHWCSLLKVELHRRQSQHTPTVAVYAFRGCGCVQEQKREQTFHRPQTHFHISFSA